MKKKKKNENEATKTGIKKLNSIKERKILAELMNKEAVMKDAIRRASMPVPNIVVGPGIK